MQNRKYQVFISSTYSDLVEERKKVLDVLLMADCIPAGMEAFVATDVEQFEVIKKVIDLCDYYILIIGQRYGSINPDTGISYTEMEYDYAIKNKIPVLVFVLDEQIVLPDDKKENEPDKVERLKAFREKVGEDVKVFPISAIIHEGVDQVLYAVADALETAPKFDMEEVEENTVVYNVFGDTWVKSSHCGWHKSLHYHNLGEIHDIELDPENYNVYDIIEYLEEDESNRENVDRIKAYLAVNGAKNN